MLFRQKNGFLIRRVYKAKYINSKTYIRSFSKSFCFVYWVLLMKIFVLFFLSSMTDNFSNNSPDSQQHETYRSSSPEVFCKKGVLRNFAKFTGKHLCQNATERLFDRTPPVAPAEHRCLVFGNHFLNVPNILRQSNTKTVLKGIYISISQTTFSTKPFYVFFFF